MLGMKLCVNLQYSFFLLKIVILQQHFQTVSTSNANAIIREAPENAKKKDKSINHTQI